MDTPSHCKKCGMIFSKVSLLWKHKIETEACTHLVCEGCLVNSPSIDFDVDGMVLNNRNFLKVKWQDDYNCARAIMIGKAKVDKDSDYRKIKNNSLWNLCAALYLHNKSKVIPGKCGVQEVQLFQEALPDYQIFYIAKTCSHKPLNVLYIGPEAEKKIYIYEHNGLFDAIGRISGHMMLSIFGY